MSVTICIPTYNQADYVEASIRSAVNQAFQPKKIIVSNDCSTDNTAEILDRLEKEIDILEVYHQDKNLGIERNPDTCLRMATTKYVVRLDSDDLLEENYVYELFTALEANPKAGYAHGMVQEIDENGSPLRIRKLFRNIGYIDHDRSLRESISGYKVAANIIMFRRDALEAVDYMNHQMAFAEDYFLSVSIAAAGYGNVYINRVLSSYRVWTDSGNQRMRRKKAEIEGFTKVFVDGIEPAFRERNWLLEPIARKRAVIAIRQANCLNWTIFTDYEKDELELEILKLSDVLSVRMAIKCYRNGMGFIYDVPYELISYLKKGIKNIQV
jgi:hypothetical protein